jgi:hypothetical protein
MPSTKAARGGIFSGVFNKDVKVPLQEAELVGTSSSNTKHIKIRYYYVVNRIAKGDLRVVWCPMDKMIADFLTKPLQGKAFVKFWDLLMGAV